MAPGRAWRYRASQPCCAQTYWRWDQTKRWCVLSIPFSRIFDSHCIDGPLASAFAFPLPGVLGTLIIENAGALSPSDQRRLFDWLTVTRGDIRIVSTTALALLPLVESGSFIASLYYRLNIVCIDVAAPSCDLDVACAVNIPVRSL